MPDLYSSKHIQKILGKNGFVVVSQRGSHIKLRKIGKETLTVIVPANRKEIPHGTFRSILRQSKLNAEIFKEALKNSGFCHGERSEPCTEAALSPSLRSG